jgi:hypothetical protein
MLEQIEHFNFTKIEEILTQCQDMISSSGAFAKQREEKISQIKLLYDKAHEYKVKHAAAWKTEEDSDKRAKRLNNLVDLFKICKLLKNVVTEQIALPSQ